MPDIQPLPLAAHRPIPVYDGYLADPFAWNHDGVWYMVGTGSPEKMTDGGRYFPALISRDFKSWEFAGHILNPAPPELGGDYWAPEVAYFNGKFYMYYSVGHADVGHKLRVAAADSPLGPYEDAGITFTDPEKTPFAIDPSPFRDDDGSWYLFYARDFLDTENGFRPGTALVADRLTDMLHLAGEETTILRGRRDWQRFMANRPMYGKLYDWHTLEGACIVKRDGKYICLYSGGRWESEFYGVDYGIAESPLGPYEDTSNDIAARITRTKPGVISGPGHNSVVLGPDDKETYIVYHGWNADLTVRSPYISRLDWKDGLPQPVVFE